MKLEVYNKVIDCFQRQNTRIKLTKLDRLVDGIPSKTLGSIYSQEYQRKMKKTHYKHYNFATMQEYYYRYLDELGKGNTNTILRLADEVDISPALMARLILDRHLFFTNPAGGPDQQPVPVPRSVVTDMLRDTTLITDPVLAAEIQQCVLEDDIYGPIVDTIKHSIGHEYEMILERTLKERGLAYLGEDQLRLKGYDKTPDFKLEVPIAVNGYIVNWIESKASFGDEESHRTYLKEQFWSYWNRFGPGLVIYWFGFIDELDSNRDKGILLMDHFPESITHMDPAMLKPT